MFIFLINIIDEMKSASITVDITICVNGMLLWDQPVLLHSKY